MQNALNRKHIRPFRVFFAGSDHKGAKRSDLEPFGAGVGHQLGDKRHPGPGAAKAVRHAGVLGGHQRRRGDPAGQFGLFTVLADDIAATGAIPFAGDDVVSQ